MAPADIGLPSGAMGNADRTTIDVSLRRNTSSMKWSTEKHTRGSASPHCCCGKPVQNSRPCCVPGSTAVVQEVPLHVEHELVARQRGPRRVGIDGRGRRHRERPAGLASHRLSRRLLRAGVDGEERRRRAAQRSEEPSARHARCAGRCRRSRLRARRCASRATGVSGAGSYSPLEQGPSSMGRCSPGTSTPSRRRTAGRGCPATRFPTPVPRGGGRSRAGRASRRHPRRSTARVRRRSTRDTGNSSA